jgi:hypothetical protein
VPVAYFPIRPKAHISTIGHDGTLSFRNFMMMVKNAKHLNFEPRLAYGQTPKLPIEVFIYITGDVKYLDNILNTLKNLKTELNFKIWVQISMNRFTGKINLQQEGSSLGQVKKIFCVVFSKIHCKISGPYCPSCSMKRLI